MGTPKVCWLILLLLWPIQGQAAPQGLLIVVFGDSLTSGFGLLAEQAFPAQLEQALLKQGYQVRVQNAGVAGDTSQGALARLDWSLSPRPDLVIVELGANDALRGIDPVSTRNNLDKILSRIKLVGAQPLLMGMRAPRNMGRNYYIKFDQLYPELALDQAVPFYPFFLAEVVGRQHLNQQDGIHPNAAGVARIVKLVLPLIKEVLITAGVFIK